MGHRMKSLNPGRSLYTQIFQGQADFRCPADANCCFREVFPPSVNDLDKCLWAKWGTGLFGFESHI